MLSLNHAHVVVDRIRQSKQDSKNLLGIGHGVTFLSAMLWCGFDKLLVYKK